MRREQAQILRLLFMCAAWAVGQMLVFGIPLGPGGGLGFDLIIPAGLAIGVYVVTDDLGRSSYRRDLRGREVKYWRGRPVDDDRPDRLN